MKRITAAVITAAIFFNILTVAAPAYETEEYGVFDEGSVIVAIKPDSVRLFGAADYEDIGVSDAVSLRSKNRIRTFSSDDEPDILKLTLEEKGADNVIEAVNTLNERPEVLFAEPNYIFTASSLPDDTYYNDASYNYALNTVNAPQVWDMDVDCSDVTVAVLDTGTRITHEDLAENIWVNPGETADGTDSDGNGYVDDINGWNFYSSNSTDEMIVGDNNVYDDIGHGTHVAGIVSAVTNNGKGVASLARNAKIVPLRIFNSNGLTSLDIIAEAFEYSKTMGFDIVNCSFGGVTGETVQTLKLITSECPNTLFVAASGNVEKKFPTADNDIQPVYPASLSLECDNVIAVANSTKDEVIATNSHYGKTSVNIAAPGASVKSTYNTGNSSYKDLSGTSMSTPLVASAAAVIKAVNPDLTGTQIREILTDTADKLPSYTDKVSSGGRLNAYAAAQAAKALLPTPVPTEQPNNYIKFTRGGENGNDICAELKFVSDEPPAQEDISVYVAYKQDGVLRNLQTPTLNEGLKAEFSVPEEFSDCSVTVYVWDKKQCPYMKPQELQ